MRVRGMTCPEIHRRACEARDKRDGAPVGAGDPNLPDGEQRLLPDSADAPLPTLERGRARGAPAATTKAAR